MARQHTCALCALVTETRRAVLHSRTFKDIPIDVCEACFLHEQRTTGVSVVDRRPWLLLPPTPEAVA